MADDLRERIRRSDLAALANPALPLHLLVEPVAAWWREGSRRAVRLCIQALVHLADAGLAELAFDWWADDLHAAGRISRKFSLQAHRLANPGGSWPEQAQEYLSQAAIFVPQSGGCSAQLELARRLCALLENVPPEIEVALVVLQHYASD